MKAVVGKKANLSILLLEFPDDYYEDVHSILLKLYSKREITKLKKQQ